MPKAYVPITWSSSPAAASGACRRAWDRSCRHYDPWAFRPRPARTRVYATDANGSVTGLEQSDGVVLDNDRYSYDPYGQLDQAEPGLSADAAENPFRFQGFYFDAQVNTYDMGARNYRPAEARFLQPDTYEDANADLALQADPLTQNRYAFAAGNPTNNIEAGGHMPSGQGDEPVIADREQRRERRRAADAAGTWQPNPGQRRQAAIGAAARGLRTAAAKPAQASSSQPRPTGPSAIERWVQGTPDRFRRANANASRHLSTFGNGAWGAVNATGDGIGWIATLGSRGTALTDLQRNTGLTPPTDDPNYRQGEIVSVVAGAAGAVRGAVGLARNAPAITRASRRFLIEETGGIRIAGAAQGAGAVRRFFSEEDGFARIARVRGDPDAVGPHSVMKRDTSGRVTGYTTYGPDGRPVMRFRGTGRSHGNMEPPIVYEPRPGKVGGRPVVPRAPADWELPSGY